MKKLLLLLGVVLAVLALGVVAFEHEDGLVTPIFLEVGETLEDHFSVERDSDAILDQIEQENESIEGEVDEVGSLLEADAETEADAEAETEADSETEAETDSDADASVEMTDAEFSNIDSMSEMETGLIEVENDGEAEQAAAGEGEAAAATEGDAAAATEGEAAAATEGDAAAATEGDAAAATQDGSDVVQALDESTQAEAAANAEAQAASGEVATVARPTNPTYVLPFPPIVPGHYTPFMNPYTNVNPLSTPFAKNAVEAGAHPGVAAVAASRAGHLSAIATQATAGGAGQPAVQAAGGYPYLPFTARHPVIAEQLQGNPVPFSGYAGWVHPQNMNSAAVGENAGAASLGQFLEVETEISIDSESCIGCSYLN